MEFDKIIDDIYKHYEYYNSNKKNHYNGYINNKFNDVNYNYDLNNVKNKQ